MKRRSFPQVEAQARAEERVGVKRHAAEHADRVARALASGKISEEVADLTRAHIASFADEIATGLHLDGHDSVDTRRETRAGLERAGLLAGRGAQ